MNNQKVWRGGDMCKHIHMYGMSTCRHNRYLYPMANSNSHRMKNYYTDFASKKIETREKNKC